MGRKYRPQRTRNRRRSAQLWKQAIQRRSWAEPLEPRMLLAADPVINEFQAVNVSTIQDSQGDFEDWIEIRNRGTDAINLAGWYLTDDNTDLRKWEFPSVTVGPGEHLLVFASGKYPDDMAGIPANELHTNFRLAADGEYLGLVKPDGITVAQDYDPYPAQFPDQSYGLAPIPVTTELIPDDAAIKAFVPNDNSLAQTWTQLGFNDSAWPAGTTAVGYEELIQGTTQREEFTSALGPEWTVDTPAGGNPVTVSGGALRFRVPVGQDTTTTDRGNAPIVYRDIAVGDPFPEGFVPPNFSIETRISRDPSTSGGGAGLMLYGGSVDRPVIQLEYLSALQFRMYAQGETIGSRINVGRTDFFLRLERDGSTNSWTGYYKIDANDSWTEIGSIADGENGLPVVLEPKAAMYARTSNGAINADFQYLEIDIADQTPVYGPEIGLDVNDAMRLVNSSIYMRMPFTVSGDPARFDEMVLTTRYDDGFRAFLNGVEVTAQNVPSLSTWNSYASGVYGAVGANIPIQQIDLSNHRGVLRTGANVLAIHGMNNVLQTDPLRNDPDFFFDAELAATEILPGVSQFFITPTPGATNELPAAPAPRIEGGDGIFFGSKTFELVLDEPSPSLEIRYTLDGSDPTLNSLLYTGPITLTQSARLQARTFDTSGQNQFVPGNVVSGTFIAMDPALRDFSSDIPVLVLDTLGQALPSTSSTSLVGMNVVLFDVSKATGRASLDGGIVDYLGRGGARDRGSSTAAQPKPNMTFETWGPNGTGMDDDTDVSLLGLPADSDWTLHAPYTFDRALIRNQLAFDMSNDMGMWATNWRHVEVYFNRARDGVVGTADYAGVYVLTERIQEGQDRIDIKDSVIEPGTPPSPDLPEMSGGYIWKIDRSDPCEPAFTAGAQSINWVYPKSPFSCTAQPDQKATVEQQQWVTNYFNQFANTLRNPDINADDGYSQYINPISWVDHHMLNVWMMNVDALRLSAYFYKDQDGRVDYGPVWDFDRSAESDDNRDDDPYVWRSENGDLGTDFFGNGTQRWWGDLFRDPGFWQLYVDRWQMWRRTVLSDEYFSDAIDRIADQLGSGEALDRNFAKWPNTRPRSASGFNSGLLNGTWQGEIENMRQWLIERAAFMDANFVQPAIFEVNGQQLPDVPGVYVTPGQEVAISGPLLTFYNDTPLVSGDVGVTTARYFVPTDNSLGTSWTQRTFNDSSWSAGPTGIGFDTGSDFTNVIATDVRPSDKNPDATTILTRIPFQISNLQEARSNDLVLKMKYDDGFVAYLNGTLVLEHNLREPLAWDSRASTRSTPLDRDMAETWVDFDLSAYKNLLVAGTNVLAIRGINSSASSNDMLILPELVSREVLFGVNPASKVYYTTDGSDPRGEDGNPSPSATLLPQGQTITINQNTRVIARNFDNVTDRGEQSRKVGVDEIYWSGPVQYDFVTGTAPLVISEINYNPGPVTQAEADAGYGNDDFEFIEIYNPSNQAVDLLGVKLTDGVEFDFYTNGIRQLPPRGRLVVVENEDAFKMRYPGVAFAGVYTGQLDNTGEDIDLQDGTGHVIFSVLYGDSDPWPVRADGVGATLELISSGTPAALQSKWYSWRGSSEYGGTPGTAGSGPNGVVINEVLAATRGADLRDAIEIYNTSSTPINIGGWYLSDSENEFNRYVIPAGTTIQPGQYIAYDERQFNFGLNQDDGDSVWLTIPGAAEGTVSRFADDVHFGPTVSGESLGRMPNGSGRLAPLARLTFGADNGRPRVGPLVITELQYNPVISDAALAVYPEVDESDLEFVEIHNPTGQSFDLTNWRLRAGADFDFPAGTQLAAGETIVVLKFDPVDPENINELNAFKAQYGIGNNVRLLGGYAGRLNNSDDRVVLQRPLTPPANQPNYIPRVQEDEVLYDDQVPWPTGADGTGNSLQRKQANAFGNDPNSWFSGRPSPGVLLTSIPGDFNANGRLDEPDINLLFVQMRSANPNLSYDLTEDGKVDTEDRDELILKIFGTTYGDANLDMFFNTADLVQVLQRGKYEDGIPLNAGWGDGDWNGNGDFGTEDFVLALQAGGYEAAAAVPVAAVPRTAEPLLAVGAAVEPLPDSGENSAGSAMEQVAISTATLQSTGVRQVELVDEAIQSLFQDETDSGDVQDEGLDESDGDGLGDLT